MRQSCTIIVTAATRTMVLPWWWCMSGGGYIMRSRPSVNRPRFGSSRRHSRTTG